MPLLSPAARAVGVALSAGPATLGLGLVVVLLLVVVIIAVVGSSDDAEEDRWP